MKDRAPGRSGRTSINSELVIGFKFSRAGAPVRRSTWCRAAPTLRPSDAASKAQAANNTEALATTDQRILENLKLIPAVAKRNERCFSL